MARSFDIVLYCPFAAGLLERGEAVPPGGAETQMVMLARGFARRGYRVALVTFPVRSPIDLPDGITLVQRRDKSLSRRALVGKIAEVATIVRTLRALDAPVFLQRAAGYDTGVVAVAARLHRRRFVYSSASVVDFEFERLEPRRRNRALFHLGIRLADRIVVQTPEQEDLARRHWKRSATVIRSIAQKPPVEKQEGRGLLWIGRLTGYKRPEDFLALARQVPEVPFMMVGVPSADEPEVADRTFRDARPIPNLSVFAPMSRTALLEFMATAVAIVNTAEYEGMPNIFLEGWSMGIPALSLYHDPDGVIEREGVGGFGRGSVERLAEQARRLWKSHRDSEALSDRCRRYIADSHSEAIVISQWIDSLGLGGPIKHGSDSGRLVDYSAGRIT